MKIFQLKLPQKLNHYFLLIMIGESSPKQKYRKHVNKIRVALMVENIEIKLI